jgi:hypothetical protein
MVEATEEDIFTFFSDPGNFQFSLAIVNPFLAPFFAPPFVPPPGKISDLRKPS